MSALLLDVVKFTKSLQPFNWTEEKSIAASVLAAGGTKEEAAVEAGVTRTTIYNWLERPEFREEIDRLSLMVGMASRAERMRVVNRLVKQKIAEDGTIITEKDILDWLKFAQSETTGAKIDLSKLAEMLVEEQAPDEPNEHKLLLDQSSVVEAEVVGDGGSSDASLDAPTDGPSGPTADER